MYLHIIALDLDGTLAMHDKVAPETWTALRRSRAAGFELILVTGRRLEVLPSLGPFDEIFQAIVAENGAAIYYPRNDVVMLPFGHVAPEVADRLEALQVPLERGLAIAATWEPYDREVREVLAATGYAAAIEYNKGAVMVLPPGASKGTGLMVALQELGYSPRNLIACGDAENDRSMFTIAEVAVAVANSAPGIRELADIVLPEENGIGIQHFLELLIAGELPCTRTRAERHIPLGQTRESDPVSLSPVTLLNGNLGIVGDSGSGKSWLAGLLIEHLLRLNYQVCIIDPEGDYRALRSFPHTLLLGGDETPPPPVTDVITLFEYSNISLILDLSLWERAQQVSYVTELLHGLFSLRARRGQPHWFLIDEVQYFCPADGGPLTELISGQMREGGVGIVSYRPAQIAPDILQLIDHWLLTHVEVEESRQLMHRLLSNRIASYESLDSLPLLSQQEVFLSLGETAQLDAPPPGVVEFRQVRRIVPHVRHLHKYLRAPLPSDKRFYFNANGTYRGSRTAASLWDFSLVLRNLPVNTLEYHLYREDFEKWLRQTLHDQELARRIRKIARRGLKGGDLRDALVATVQDRFEELERLV